MSKSRTKHTPGPWTTYCYKDVIEICRPKGFPGSIALINNTVDNAEANARLIASAPEMLEALKKALFIYEQNGFDDHASNVRKLIAKATGGES